MRTFLPIISTLFSRKQILRCAAGLLAVCSSAAVLAAGLPSIDSAISVPPTPLGSTLLRGGPGAFGAGRENGKKHTGVDIVANQSSANKELYRVMAVSDAIVAYARMNGSDETGFGYTIILDHANGFYTQYSHLAQVASSGIVKKGDAVRKGQTIGYLANPPELSSGNVRAEVVKPYDKIQLHFECFSAPSGRSSTGAIAPIKKDYRLLDPTKRLTELRYKSF